MATMLLYLGAVEKGSYTVTVNSSGTKRYFTFTQSNSDPAITFDTIYVDGDYTVFTPSKLPNGGVWATGSTLTIYCEWYTESVGSATRISGFTFSISISGFTATRGISWNGVTIPNAVIKNIIPEEGVYSFNIAFSTQSLSDAKAVMANIATVEKGTDATGKKFVTSSIYPGELYIPGDTTYSNCYMTSGNIEVFGTWYLCNIKVEQSDAVQVF